MKYNIRDLTVLSLSEIKSLPDRFQILFEDGVTIETSRCKTAYSSCFWIIVREYPNIQLTHKHHVAYVLAGKPLTSTTHNDLLDELYYSVIDTYQLNTPIEKEYIWGLIFKVTSIVYNEISQEAEECVTAIDILDFINIVTNPKVEAIVDATKDEHNSIQNCYKEVGSLIKNSPDFNDNAIAVAVKSGLVNINQVLQAVAVRGRLTEVDGTILPTGVMSNFTKGLNNLYEYGAESRSAAKSLYFSDAKLQDTEYTARRIQQLCMTIESIDYIDCGTTQYLEWRINPPTKDENGLTTYPGDLMFMTGKYYLDQETNQLKKIDGDDPSLYNKVLKIRSSLFCKIDNQHNVCEVCFGGLAKNISRHVNLGHLCSATMTQQLTQSVLSIKHLDYSSSGTDIVLNDITSKYFTTDTHKSSYIMYEKFKAMGVKLIINKDEVAGLTDVITVENIETISPVRISAVEYADISFTDSATNIPLTDMLYLSQGNKRVILSMEFLKYLRVKKWKVDANNNFVFDLCDWDFNLPIFKLPEMEYSFSDHSVLISRVIESNMRNQKKRAIEGTAVSVIQELFSLVNTKINVNLSALEIIIYAVMIRDDDQYSLSRHYNKGKLGVAASVIKNRSLGTAYTYEGVKATLINPRSFFKLDRPDSCFDVFIAPEEYLRLKKRR